MLKLSVCVVIVLLLVPIVYSDDEDYLSQSNDEDTDEEKPKPEPVESDDGNDSELEKQDEKSILVVVEKEKRLSTIAPGIKIEKNIQELATRLFPKIECDNFAAFVLMCTVESTKIYNTSSKAPPLPMYFQNWCKAIKFMIYCATSWNQECGTKTESHFSEESLKGHIHVLKNICDDKSFVKGYDAVAYCLEDSRILWEKCYSKFKKNLDELKKTKLPLTHYDTHFRLCCLRASFISCTSNIYRKNLMICSKKESDIMQKFSIVIAEGDIYQNCDNTVYENCPSGDPRRTLESARLKEKDSDTGTRKKKKKKKSKSKKSKQKKTKSKSKTNEQCLDTRLSDCSKTDKSKSEAHRIELINNKDFESKFQSEYNKIINTETDGEPKRYKEYNIRPGKTEIVSKKRENKPKKRKSKFKEDEDNAEGLRKDQDKDLEHEEDLENKTIVQPSNLSKIITTTAVTTAIIVTTTEESINCDELERYARVCSAEARDLYDFKEKVPPKPPYFIEWCRSIDHLINCAVNWHEKCKNNTNYYGDNSIMDLPGVLDNICRDTTFTSQYSDILFCLEETRPQWEECYSWFKASVDKEKEMQVENHIATHFRLCCIQFNFLKCTAEFYSEKLNRCSKNEGLILQTVTRVIAQTDIFQVCKGHNNDSCPNEVFRQTVKPSKRKVISEVTKYEEFENDLIQKRYNGAATLNYKSLIIVMSLYGLWKSQMVLLCLI